MLHIPELMLIRVGGHQQLLTLQEQLSHELGELFQSKENRINSSKPREQMFWAPCKHCRGPAHTQWPHSAKTHYSQLPWHCHQHVPCPTECPQAESARVSPTSFRVLAHPGCQSQWQGQPALGIPSWLSLPSPMAAIQHRKTLTATVTAGL